MERGTYCHVPLKKEGRATEELWWLQAFNGLSE